MRNRIVIAVMGVVATASVFAAPDWSKVPARNIPLFYPGQAGLEWVMNVVNHSSVSGIANKKYACFRCHEIDATEIGDDIVVGKPVGSSKSVLEPAPIPGKAGSLFAKVQIAHDDAKIYFRFEWESPKATGGKKMDPKNEVKLTLMFDGGGTVESSEISGCWVTCHTDLRTMQEARDDKKTKYVREADLAGGRFMDLIQFRSGMGEQPVDGYVDSERHMEAGKSLLKAEGGKEGGKWVVTFERELFGRGKGDHSIVADRIYNFGFAIHEDYANARYHYVSLGYRFGFDKAIPKVKNYIAVQE